MYTSIRNAQVGDVIVEGKRETQIERIDHDACSSWGTHINNRLCYDRGAEVLLKTGSVSVED